MASDVLKYGVDSSAVLAFIRQHSAIRLAKKPATLVDYMIGTEMNPETYEASMYRRLDACLNDSSSTAVTLLVAQMGGGKTQALRYYEDVLMRTTLASLKRDEAAKLLANTGKVESAIHLAMATKCFDLPLYIDVARTPSLTPDNLPRQTAEDLLRICGLKPEDLFRADVRTSSGLPLATRLQRFRPVWLLDNLGDPASSQCFGPLMAELSSRFSGRVVAACAEPYIQHVLKNKYVDMFAPVLTLTNSIGSPADAAGLAMTAAALAKVATGTKVDPGHYNQSRNGKVSASLRVFHISLDPEAPLAKLLTLSASHALSLVYERDAPRFSQAQTAAFPEMALKLSMHQETNGISHARLKLQHDMDIISHAAHRISQSDVATYTPALAACLRNPSMLTYLAVRCHDLFEAVTEAKERAHARAILENLAANGTEAAREARNLEAAKALASGRLAPVALESQAQQEASRALQEAQSYLKSQGYQKVESLTALASKVSSKAFNLVKDVLREYFRVALHRFAASGILRTPGTGITSGAGAAASAMTAALLRRSPQSISNDATLGLGLGLGGLGYPGTTGLGPLEHDWSTFVDDCFGLCEELAAFCEDRANQVAQQLDQARRMTAINAVSGAPGGEREVIAGTLDRQRASLSALLTSSNEVDLDSPDMTAVFMRVIQAREAISAASQVAPGLGPSAELLPEERLLYARQSAAVMLARARVRNQIEQMRGIHAASGIEGQVDGDGAGALLALLQAQQIVSPIYRRLLCMTAPLRSAMSSLVSRVGGGNRFVFWSPAFRDFFLTSFEARGGTLVAKIAASAELEAKNIPQALGVYPRISSFAHSTMQCGNPLHESCIHAGLTVIPSPMNPLIMTQDHSMTSRSVPQITYSGSSTMAADKLEKVANMKRGIVTPVWVRVTPPHSLAINPFACGGCRRALVSVPQNRLQVVDSSDNNTEPPEVLAFRRNLARGGPVPLGTDAAPFVQQKVVKANDVDLRSDPRPCPCCRVYNICAQCDVCIRCSDEIAVLERDAAILQSGTNETAMVPQFAQGQQPYGVPQLTRGLNRCGTCSCNCQLCTSTRQTPYQNSLHDPNSFDEFEMDDPYTNLQRGIVLGTDPKSDTALLAKMIDHLKHSVANQGKSSQDGSQVGARGISGLNQLQVQDASNDANEMKSPRRCLTNLIATQVLGNALAADSLSPLQAQNQAAQQIQALQLMDQLWAQQPVTNRGIPPIPQPVQPVLNAANALNATSCAQPDGDKLWSQPHRHPASASNTNALNSPVALGPAQDALKGLANMRGIDMSEVLAKLNQQQNLVHVGPSGYPQPLVTLRCGCEVWLPHRTPSGEVLLGRPKRMCDTHKLQQQQPEGYGGSLNSALQSEDLLKYIQPGDTSARAVRDVYAMLAKGAGVAQSQDIRRPTDVADNLVRAVPQLPLGGGQDVHLELAPQLFGDGQRRGKNSLSDQIATARERAARKNNRLQEVVASLGLENVIRPEKLRQFIPPTRKAHLFRGLQCAIQCAGYLCVGSTEGLHLFDEDDLVAVDVVLLRQSVTALAVIPKTSEKVLQQDRLGNNVFLVVGLSSGAIVVLDAAREFEEVYRHQLVTPQEFLVDSLDTSIRQIEPHPDYPHTIAVVTESVVQMLTFNATCPGRPIELAVKQLWISQHDRRQVIDKQAYAAIAADSYNFMGLGNHIERSRVGWPTIRLRRAKWWVKDHKQGLLMVGDVEVLWRLPYEISNSDNLGLTYPARTQQLPIPVPLTKASRLALGLTTEKDVQELHEARRQYVQMQLAYGLNAPSSLPIVALGDDNISSFVRDFAFSPDRNFQAVAIMHGAAPLLQNMTTGRVIELQAPPVQSDDKGVVRYEYISRVCWSADGTLLVAGGDAGSLMIYRIISGEGKLHIHMPKAAGGTVMQTLWDRDENLVTLSHSGVMKRWEMNPLQTSLALETEVIGDHINE